MTVALSPLVGVDGCKGGWIAVTRHSVDTAPHVAIHRSFRALADAAPPNAIIAVDMPIGLPDSLGPGGRGPEALVRMKLGRRRSSVFSMPSRRAIFAEIGPFADALARYAAHRRASDMARLTSDPARGVSIQAFGLFDKIRQLDEVLRADPALAERVYESHPELAFCMLNGGRPMSLPKKVGGRIDPAAMAERRALLEHHGMPAAFLMQAVPRGAGADDFLDAAVMMLVAGRIALGEAEPHPDPPTRDAHGLTIAIWA